MIRRATADEADAVALLFRAVWTQCLPYLPVLHTLAEDRWFFRHRVFAACEVWVAGAEALDGFCAFRPGWIDHLYVRPQHHGRGLGSALIAQAMRTHPELALWAFQRNARAIRFYEARGFRLVEQTDGSSNEEGEPDARYAWSRSP